MANVCMCFLHVIGERNKVDEFIEKNRRNQDGQDVGLAFSALLPAPAGSNGDWNKENWGCRWETPLTDPPTSATSEAARPG